MTNRDDLLERLQQANPVPDPGRIYDDAESAQRLHAAVEAKRQGPVQATTVVPFVRRNMAGFATAAAAFATVIAVVGGGLVLTDGDEVIDQPVSTTAVEEIPTTTAATLPPSTTTPPLPTTTTEPPPPTSTTSTSTTTSTTVPAPTSSILSAADPAPDGVAAVAGPIMGEGDSLCSNNREDLDYPYSGPPLVRLDAIVGGGIGPFFCFFGFDLDRPLLVEVSSGGTVLRSYAVAPTWDIGGAGLVDDSFAFVWRQLPTDPLGPYEIRATQDVGSVSMAFEMAAPTQRGLSVEPRTVPAGSAVEIVLFGYPANTEVPLHIYREGAEPPSPIDPRQLEYATTVVVTTDANGWAVVRIETGVNDPLVGYWVDADPETEFQPAGCICPFAPDVFQLVPGE